MKQATRIARRQEREQREKEMQAIYDQRFKEKQAQERKESYKSFFKTTFWVSLFAFPMYVMIHNDNIAADKRQAELTVKLNAWNAYKDKNCTQVEKLYGMQMGSGKFRYVDNGTVYQCNNGMKYTLSDGAAQGHDGIDSIPTIK